jgi:hypothetical protein
LAKLRSLKALKREALKAWGKVILARYPKCAVCETEPSKHPHHLFPRSRYLHLQMDLRNGRGLCIQHHYQIHYDPIIPLLKILSTDLHPTLITDARLGRRKNPYRRIELENIITALKGAINA